MDVKEKGMKGRDRERREEKKDKEIEHIRRGEKRRRS